MIRGKLLPWNLSFIPCHSGCGVSQRLAGKTVPAVTYIMSAGKTVSAVTYIIMSAGSRTLSHSQSQVSQCECHQLGVERSSSIQCYCSVACGLLQSRYERARHSCRCGVAAAHADGSCVSHTVAAAHANSYFNISPCGDTLDDYVW